MTSEVIKVPNGALGNDLGTEIDGLGPKSTYSSGPPASGAFQTGIFKQAVGIQKLDPVL